MKTYKLKTNDFLFFTALALWIMNSMLQGSALAMPSLVSYTINLMILIILSMKWLLKSQVTCKKFIYMILILLLGISVYRRI